MKIKLKSPLNLYSDRFERQWEAAVPRDPGLPGPSVLIQWPAGSEWQPSPGSGSADRGTGGCWGSRVGQPGAQRSPVLGPCAHWAGRSLKQGMQQRSQTVTVEPTSPHFPSADQGPGWAGAYCWDKSALRFAFIFSRRFTKWPLLTSSSSVLSSAERSSLWSFRFSALSSSSIFSAFSAADL